jgi:heme/copper-type cytochrome/quinol oxidase subunit 2
MGRIGMIMKGIINARTSWWHFILIFLISVVTITFLYFLIPFIFWFIYGEGELAARIENLPLSIFISEWSPLLIVLAISFCTGYLNIAKKDFSRAKSYLFGSILIIIIYSLKQDLSGFLFGV